MSDTDCVLPSRTSHVFRVSSPMIARVDSENIDDEFLCWLFPRGPRWEKWEISVCFIHIYLSLNRNAKASSGVSTEMDNVICLL